MLDGEELLIDTAGDNATFRLKRLDINISSILFPQNPPTSPTGTARPLDHSTLSLISPAIIPGNSNVGEYDAVHHVGLVDYGISGSCRTSLHVKQIFSFFPFPFATVPYGYPKNNVEVESTDLVKFTSSYNLEVSIHSL